jgi:flavin reductase (DIM6/NTAB) family NADH-FMN oxidoreductase RutF
MREPIDFDDLRVEPHRLWDKQWLLLTAGDYRRRDFNTMTVAWGSLGTMWGKPFAQVVVRPTRHTFGFIEGSPDFTLTVFPERFREALLLLGTKSGRDGDKIAESGLTPVASTIVGAPTLDEAELVLECRKIYFDDMDPSRFLAPDIEAHYPERDYHRVYFGEIVTILGEARYDGSRQRRQP